MCCLIPSEFLEHFFEKYGSFIPLREEDILEYLNKHLNADLKDRQVCFHDTKILVNLCTVAYLSIFHVQEKNDTHRSDEVQSWLGLCSYEFFQSDLQQANSGS